MGIFVSDCCLNANSIYILSGILRDIVRRRQDFVWGALFFLIKVNGLFLVVLPKTQAYTTN